MMKTISYVTDEALETIKANLGGFYAEMKKHPDGPEWIGQYLRLNPFLPSKYEIDFEFEIGDVANVKEYDYSNAVGLYEAFKKAGIPDIVIYDEKFMVGFTLTIGYQYFMARMGLEKQSRLENTLLFPSGTRRSIAQHTVGRLYKEVCLTRDPSLDDPYELTKFAFNNPASLRIVYYTFMDNEKVSLSYFRSLKRWCSQTGETLTIKTVDGIRSRLALFCNVTIAEALPEEEIISCVLNYLENR